MTNEQYAAELGSKIGKSAGRIIGILIGSAVIGLLFGWWAQYLMAEIFNIHVEYYKMFVSMTVLSLMTPMKFKGIWGVILVIGTLYSWIF
jgi:hypothetical protein